MKALVCPLQKHKSSLLVVELIQCIIFVEMRKPYLMLMKAEVTFQRLGGKPLKACIALAVTTTKSVLHLPVELVQNSQVKGI